MGKVVLASVVLLFVVLVQPVFANDGHDHDGAGEGAKMMDDPTMMGHDAMVEQDMAKKEVVKAVEVGNKICPVSGEKIEPSKMGDPVTYEYNGKIYNLCCGMCVKDFKKDPEKYSKIAEDEVAAVAAQPGS